MTASDTTPVALVTGAGSGIGADVVGKLAAMGYRVALVGRTASKLERVGNSLDGLEGAQWIQIPADVGVPEQAEEMVDETVDTFGRIDALINNAGWTELLPIARHDAAMVRKIFEINAMGPIWAIIRALPKMKAQRGGVIVNVSTMGTQDPFKGLGVYGSAKAACETICKAIAAEHARDKIKAYCVGPGAVETALLRSLFSEKAVPADKTIQPEEIAQIIVDCVTGATDLESGQTRHVAGAFH
ncbi:MAG: SDR family oxidoreductase [Planctomycetota bacterium]